MEFVVIILFGVIGVMTWYVQDASKEAQMYRTWFENERERNEKLAEKIAKLNKEQRNGKVQGR